MPLRQGFQTLTMRCRLCRPVRNSLICCTPMTQTWRMLHKRQPRQQRRHRLVTNPLPNCHSRVRSSNASNGDDAHRKHNHVVVDAIRPAQRQRQQMTTMINWIHRKRISALRSSNKRELRPKAMRNVAKRMRVPIDLMRSAEVVAKKAAAFKRLIWRRTTVPMTAVTSVTIPSIGSNAIVAMPTNRKRPATIIKQLVQHRTDNSNTAADRISVTCIIVAVVVAVIIIVMRILGTINALYRTVPAVAVPAALVTVAI